MGRVRCDPGFGGRRGCRDADRPGAARGDPGQHRGRRPRRASCGWSGSWSAARSPTTSTPCPSPADGFDDPAQLDAFLDAVRWGAIASADKTVLQAPFRSGIQIEDYQLDPVVRALSMPRTNLLIADDVGLGKTIEAGLVMQELMLRHRARTMLIVCPAGLTLQWRDEMRDKFGLDVPHRRRGPAPRAAPLAWAVREPVDALPAADRQHRLAEAGPADAAAARGAADRAEIPADVRHADRRRGAHLRAVRAGASTRWTRCAPRRSAPWRRTASTGCSCPRPRTTATRSRSPRCWSCWTTSASPAGVRPSEAQLARIMVRRLKRDLPPKWDGTPRFPGAGRSATWRSGTPADERHAHRAARPSMRPAAARRAGGEAGRGRRRLRHHAAEEAAVLLAEGVRRDHRDAPARP